LKSYLQGLKMNKLSVKSNIASELKRRILDGEYAPGSMMPNQSQLTKEFKTSFSTITKALKEVKEHGLIELSPKRGTRVLPLAERPAKGLVGIIIWRAEKPIKPEPLLMIAGICQQLTENNQHYELIYMLHSDNQNRNLLDELERYVGFIFVEMLASSSSLLQELERHRFPYAVANLEEECDFTSTWVDHRKTTSMAVKFMLAFGHRRIAILTRDLTSLFYKRAFAGYKNGLEHAGIELDENLIIIADGYESTIAYNAMKKYLTQYPTPPTAIIACRDYLAAGAWQALDEVGFTIGTDVSIIGFDNLSWPEGKNLTTFEEPASELGRIAAEILIKRITYGFTSIEKRELKAPLILRSSVGPCPQVDAEAISLKLYQ
jgi:DNA-binding LacI/PurR family transcriptional regulator